MAKALLFEMFKTSDHAIFLFVSGSRFPTNEYFFIMFTFSDYQYVQRFSTQVENHFQKEK